MKCEQCEKKLKNYEIKGFGRERCDNCKLTDLDFGEEKQLKRK